MDTSHRPDWILQLFPPGQRLLRVAVVTETYPPEINGVALTVDRLVRGLQARHHDVQLIRPRQTRADSACSVAGFEEVLTRGMPIPRYPHLRMGLPAKGSLTQHWAHHRPDIVHIATEGPLGWSALQAARKLHIPVSSDFRTNFHAYSRHYGVGWLGKPIAAYLRKFHNLADCTMVPTAQLQSELDRMGFQRLHVVGRGVDTVRFDPQHRSTVLRRQWGLESNGVAMLYVGRLAAEKNLALLVRAAHQLHELAPNSRLIVVGEGPMRSELEKACPQARFCGALSGHELAQHYASADVFVFPSLTETYGNVTAEALASGLGVVAFDYAAAADLVVHHHNGLLAPVGDDTRFLEWADSLCSNPGLLSHVRSHARSRVLPHAWDTVVTQIESIWLGLVPTPSQQAAPLTASLSVP
jgi:glycosyltransferase involved in cell wall biosynthesis